MQEIHNEAKRLHDENRKRWEAKRKAEQDQFFATVTTMPNADLLAAVLNRMMGDDHEGEYTPDRVRELRVGLRELSRRLLAADFLAAPINLEEWPLPYYYEGLELPETPRSA